MKFLWRTDEPFWLAAALSPLTALSWAYAAVSVLQRPRPFRAAVPAISVGNVVAGGAGKTPVALEIARRLLDRGLRVSVLSRGYRRRGNKDLVVEPETPWADAGDEPALVKERLPAAQVLVGARRAPLARRAVWRGTDVLVLDDGLQHLSLARDLDVVVVDASNPLGNGRRLPRGPLRESPARAFQRAAKSGLLWLTRCDLPRDPRTDDLVQAARSAGLGGPVESVFAASAPLPRTPAFLFAGIARAESFEALVRAASVPVVGSRWFPDHHPYSTRDLQSLREAATAANASVLLTTEKDLVRIAPAERAGPPPVRSVPVDLRILSGEDALAAALEQALGPRK